MNLTLHFYRSKDHVIINEYPQRINEYPINRMASSPYLIFSFSLQSLKGDRKIPFSLKSLNLAARLNHLRESLMKHGPLWKPRDSDLTGWWWGPGSSNF